MAKTNKHKKTRITISIDPEIKEKILEARDVRLINISDLIEQYLRKYFKKVGTAKD